MPALKDHGLEFVDPFEKMKMRDKSLKDMGSENFDLSALPSTHTFGCIWIVLKMFPDVILLDVEGSPILQIKDVKHAAAAREASSRAEAYCSCSLTSSRLAPADTRAQVHQRARSERGRASAPHSNRVHASGYARAGNGCRNGHGRHFPTAAAG